MNIFWSTMTGLASIVTIIIWIRTCFKENPRQLIYPILIVILTVISTWNFFENQELKSVKQDAAKLVDSWPSPDRIKFCNKGERIGIILGGMAFLEKHKENLPDTYLAAQRLIEVRTGNFGKPENRDASYEEYNLLEDTSSAMVELIRTISK